MKQFCLDFYIFEDSSRFEDLNFSEHWMYFLSFFVFLMTYLSYIFFLDALFSPQLMMRKREKINF